MVLDGKNLRILQELDPDPKMSVSSLARKVRLAQQVVDYRVKRMGEEGVINHFGTLINLSKLGFQQYRVFLQLNKVSDKERKEILKYLKNTKRVYWAAAIGGRWDIHLVVWIRDYSGFEEFLDKLFSEFPSKIKDYEAVYATHHEFFEHSFLNPEKKSSKSHKLDFGSWDTTPKLDKLDYKILDKIKNNCRLSSLQIANECKTTYKTVQNRIKKLEKEKIIVGNRLFLRSEKQGQKAYILLISFSNYMKHVEKEIFTYGQNNSLITQILRLFGDWNLLVHLRAASEKELQETVVALRDSFPIIGRYEIIPIFEDISIDHFPMSCELI